ncbi:DUF6164 family protein [Pseudoxanthomonas dokdonensis]|uniref:Membrane protein n=1 Tax=Pseudoxanthomonas dokdonensis TaxID=344882 RepID=A0A0R0CTF4_9GAMM|nr:DUF6164 family protein [Pseudoxanthomonas dokdonensis]KRG69182.1 membrane protein [Pseudoxanthomonas dokdonensis]
MARLFFNLRNVPDDEAADVRELLDQHGIGYYETQPSPWGISAGGIWLSDENQRQRARELLDQYQLQRRTRALADRQAAIRDGSAETFARALMSRPLYVLVLLAAIALIVALTLALPFLLLG